MYHSYVLTKIYIWVQYMSMIKLIINDWIFIPYDEGLLKHKKVYHRYISQQGILCASKIYC